MYRNKLTNILRCAEKQYYSNRLLEHRSDIKKTWNILNQCIKRGAMSAKYPDYFKAEDKLITSPRDIANGFNHFFANVGPNLAKRIPQSDARATILYMLMLSHLCSCNLHVQMKLAM